MCARLNRTPPVISSSPKFQHSSFFVRQIKALPADGMPIGELSRPCGVHIETIRYYEKIKMLPAPPRTESGHRVYGPKETRILVFIRRGRELGFTFPRDISRH